MGVEYRRGQTETWRQVLPETGLVVPAHGVAEGIALFEVEGSYLTGQGVVVSGKVLDGRLKKSMHTVILGRKAKILDLSQGLKPVKSVEAGHRASLLLERAVGNFVRHGSTLEFVSGK